MEDGTGIRPSEVVYESALLTVGADPDGQWSIVSVDMSGLNLVPGQKYAILFSSNAGDGNGGAYLKFATNPKDDGGEFIYNHNGDQNSANVFAQDWYEDTNPPPQGAWGDIALRLTYNSVNVIDGTPGDDLLIGTPDDDQINGYDGHDSLRGLGGNDELNGGDGDDFVNQGGGRRRRDRFVGHRRQHQCRRRPGVHALPKVHRRRRSGVQQL